MAANCRHHSAEFKAKVVLQALTGEKTSGEIFRTHKLNANVLNHWHKEFLEQASSISGRGETHCLSE